MIKGTDVELCSREVAYTDECPCCGAAADAELMVRLRPSSRRPAADTARAILIPYCRRCTDHVGVWETGSMLSTMFVLGGVVGAILGALAGNGRLASILFVSSVGLAVVVTSIFRWRARIYCGRSCATANKAVRYYGWSGSTNAFSFLSPTYAARFAGCNASRLVNVNASLQALLDRSEPDARRPTP